MGQLGDRQQGLGEKLDELMRQFGQNGLPAPQALGEAGERMGSAEDSLRGGDRDSALGQQGEALSKLREGARGLARAVAGLSRADRRRRAAHRIGQRVRPLCEPRAVPQGALDVSGAVVGVARRRGRTAGSRPGGLRGAR
jgi:hypothetical protein